MDCDDCGYPRGDLCTCRGDDTRVTRRDVYRAAALAAILIPDSEGDSFFIHTPKGARQAAGVAAMFGDALCDYQGEL